jgi:hypothetical protein
LAARTGLVLLGFSLAASLTEEALAHKPVISRFTYNEHVLPILLERCGACHRPNGIAPMSLLSYRDTYPWAASIREQVQTLRMPPWYAEDGSRAMRDSNILAAREIDVILDWVAGGTPEGTTPLEEAGMTENVGADPDLVLAMPSEHTVSADIMEEIRRFTLTTGLGEERWIRGVDIRPGNPTIVREARVYRGSSGLALALWLPGDPPVMLGEGLAYRLPARSNLTLEVRYKKTWLNEGVAVSDRTAVGLYFAETPPAGELSQWSFGLPSRREGEARLSRRVDRDMKLLALFPEIRGSSVTTVRVEAVRAKGAREPLLLLYQPREEWPRRFWLESPMPLQRGDRIEVSATFDRSADVGDVQPPSLRLALDVARKERR